MHNLTSLKFFFIVVSVLFSAITQAATSQTNTPTNNATIKPQSDAQQATNKEAEATAVVQPASPVSAKENTKPVSGTEKDEKNDYAFSSQTVINLARNLAKSPMVPPDVAPEMLTNLDAETYQKIDFQQNKAVWGNTPTPFSIQLFAPGYLYKDLVSIDVVENGRGFPLDVSASSFTTPTPKIDEMIAKAGKYAGLRLHYPLNSSSENDEFIVFQGASYFRAISKGQSYGLSFRGLAINVAQPMGEEFPRFKHFWIERPSVTQKAIVVHALLDSQSVTGAFRFGIYPGAPTRVDVQATLFPRVDIKHVGLAPLTSMFMHDGSLDISDQPDYHPELHDSDGLQIQTGKGEMLWRPLNNPKNLQISAFVDTSPKGFGLIQRHNKFHDYQDLEANYQNRPSSWIKPLNDWGAGHIELVEIPSNSKHNDNIVAYWQPKDGLKKDTPYTYSYQLTLPNDTPTLAGKPHIVRSAKAASELENSQELLIDYSNLTVTDINKVTVDISASQGKILRTRVIKNPHIHGVRAYITFDPLEADVAELRAQLKENNQPIASTWLYRWLKQK
ncbi:glucan biosynthesis protein G [Marinomonas pollencensis]|uniref:Glucan biosynthesis protein n=1 Tax=Marinomonas pollencensis TaxID=491954 RepID=A0A3E0DQX5_9GAMM|nr:glucan biosynthesis protein G [Marinomonas pollencensis]REG84281.1 glucan biosynthesis protein [Marinomonas pollencensis]